MKSQSAINGVLVVNKPAGMTSHDVVDRARRLFRTKRIGHTGTLDPDATGVLVLCLGHATRFAEYLSASRKHYITEVQFGVQTTTLDASGERVAEADASHLDEQAVIALLPAFRGTIMQTPPMVSARHHEGRRLYELAREGVVVEREARPVDIYAVELTAFRGGREPIAVLNITCSTGTYIRVLADDLGRAAGVGAMMATLQRTWVGTDETTAFKLDKAHTLAELERYANDGALGKPVLSLAEALRSWTQVRLTEEALADLRNGQTVSETDIVEWMRPDSTTEFKMAAVLDAGGEVCAAVCMDQGVLRPVKVLT